LTKLEIVLAVADGVVFAAILWLFVLLGRALWGFRRRNGRHLRGRHSRNH
jgi:hypothetical protein